MNSPRDTPERDYVLRDTGTAVIFWLAVAVTVLMFADRVVRADWPYLGFVVPLALFAIWALWLVLFHPHVRYNSTRAMVVNVGKIHEIPWARMTAVRQRLGIVFEIAGGKSVTAAGASAPRGMGTIAGAVTGKVVNDSANFNRNADPLEAMRASAPPTDAPVIDRWDVVPLSIGAVLFVIAVVDIVVAITAA